MPDDPHVDALDAAAYELGDAAARSIAAMGGVFDDAHALMNGKRRQMIEDGWTPNDASTIIAQELRIILTAFEQALLHPEPDEEIVA